MAETYQDLERERNRLRINAAINKTSVLKIEGYLRRAKEYIGYDRKVSKPESL